MRVSPFRFFATLISRHFQLLSPVQSTLSNCNLQSIHRAPRDSFIVNSQFSIVNCAALRAAHSPVRLACVRHAASVRPEPGSNSQ